MAYRKLRKGPNPKTGFALTLLWSIISAITAILPAWGPDRRRTTEKLGTTVNHACPYLRDAVADVLPRPTSTNRLKFDSDWMKGPRSVTVPSKADQKNPSKIHIFRRGFGPPNGSYAHRYIAKQNTWTHHYVLRVSSPSMGLSIGVGLGAWEIASAQRAPPIPLCSHRLCCFTGHCPSSLHRGKSL